MASIGGPAMGELADEVTLLLLSADEWRTLGYLHGDQSKGAVCAAFLAEAWVSGGSPPTLEDLRREMPKQSNQAPRRALDPLVASGRVERERPQSRIGRVFSTGQAKNWRVVDRAGRQAIFDRVAASLGGTKPPPLRDATLAVILFASGQWERTGLDGPEPRPRVIEGPRPQPWGPLGACAQQLAAGTVIPEGVTQPDVLPLIAVHCRSGILSLACSRRGRRQHVPTGPRPLLRDVRRRGTSRLAWHRAGTARSAARPAGTSGATR